MTDEQKRIIVFLVVIVFMLSMTSLIQGFYLKQRVAALENEVTAQRTTP